MKYFYILLLSVLFQNQPLNAQSQFFSVPVKVTDKYLRDSAVVLESMDLSFSLPGFVHVRFDGEGYATPGDRIILAANNYPDWETNDGNVSFFSSVPGEGECFSHTRVFLVEAGLHSFYAVAQNYVDIEGDGIASIFGTLSVEFIPVGSGVNSSTSSVVNEFNVITPLAYDSVSIEASAAGKIEVQLNGAIDCSYDDVFVIGISESTNWDYTEPGNVAIEANVTYSPYAVISNTRVFEVAEAGEYIFYAMAQRAFEEEGNGIIYAYTNLAARYYPSDGFNLIESTSLIFNNLNLTAELSLLDSIQLVVDFPGKVEIRLDGGVQTPNGSEILLAANNVPSYEEENGRVIIQTHSEDFDRHQFVHTREFTVTPGTHTFYVMGKNNLDNGAVNVDLSGHFIAKFYPDEVVSDEVIHSGIDFDVWPNPAQEQLLFNLENGYKQMEISIYDIHGRLMAENSNVYSGISYDISNLPAGIYVAKVAADGKRGFKKFVKQ